MGDKLKHVRQGGFTVLPNTPARDARLNLAAKGLFWLMSSLPDDWDFSIRGLCSIAGDGHGNGRDAISKCLHDLEKAGYLLREQRHDDAGRFIGNTWVLYDESVAPFTDFPSTVKPSTENPSPDPTNKRVTNIPPISPQGGARGSAPKWMPKRFDAFWTAYPRKQDKQKAIRAWDRLRADDQTLEAMARGLKRWLRSEQWERGIIPLPATWLNGRRWEDETIETGRGDVREEQKEVYGWQTG